MTGHRPRCVATARPNAPHISGLVPNDAQLSGTPDLQFRTIAAMVAHARHEGENTANAVGWQHPPGFKSPILRSGLPTELPVSYRQNCGGGLFLSMAPGLILALVAVRPGLRCWWPGLGAGGGSGACLSGRVRADWWWRWGLCAC